MKTKLIAALLVCVAIGGAFTAPANAEPKPSLYESGDDKKTLPGNACKPQLKYIGNFEYKFTLTVVCVCRRRVSHLCLGSLNQKRAMLYLSNSCTMNKFVVSKAKQ